MMIRIINHKKVDLSNDEWKMYQTICRSYDRPNFKGEDLFVDHFQVNGDGIIVFVTPPEGKHTSLEVFCFLISLMVNQHLRLIHQQTDALVADAKRAIDELIKRYTKNSVEEPEQE
jgi:hypothetical protein